jgi:hypothetical protein
MKQVLTILLTLLIFLQPLCKIWLVVSFQINQTRIAKTLCIKKEIENNTCQGKCQLKKQLRESEQKEQKQAPSNTKGKVEVLYCHNQIPFNFLKQTIFYENRSLSEYKSNFYTAPFITDILRPPQPNLI